MNKDLENKLRELNIEDMIWFIYIGIIFMSWYSNSKERLYFKNNDLEAKKTYIKVTKCIFTILVIVYSYFLYDSFSASYKNISMSPSEFFSPTKLKLFTSLNREGNPEAGALLWPETVSSVQFSRSVMSDSF